MTTTDWKARAEREAAAILAELNYGAGDQVGYSQLVSLLSIAWMQGTIFGTHDTLAGYDKAFERIRDGILEALS